MSDGSRAVFLSYASQDAEVARKICESLRQAGVEVWFDAEGGLEHGDEWDAKIRRQIKECVLFIPIISANTQARHEGYFRIEWELAAQRAMGIASGVPFILPVVIDDTREPEALVPDRFRAVQWTRLRHGEVPADVLQRFLKLWSHRTGVLRHEAAQVAGIDGGASLDDGRSAQEHAGRGRATPLHNRVLVATAILALVAVASVAGFFVLRPSPRMHDEPRRPASTIASAPQSEVQGLIAQIWTIYEKQNDALREDWALAEELGARAVKLEPGNADAWAAYAQVTQKAWFYGYESSVAQFNDALSRAQKAMALAPNSIEARFALADCYRLKPSTRAEGERMLRELVQRAPTDRRILNMLAATLRLEEKPDEALEILNRAVALPGGNPNALFGKFSVYSAAGRVTEAEATLGEILAQRPSPTASLYKLFYQLQVHGDLTQARATLETIPPSFLLQEDGAYLASQVWLWSHEPARCLAALSGLSQDFLGNRFTADAAGGRARHGGRTAQPQAFLTGQAQQMAGRTAAAQADWRAALQKVDGQLVADPNEPLWLFWKARLLACLGDRVEAERSLQAFRQLAPDDSSTKFSTALVDVPLGRLDEATALLDDVLHDQSISALANGYWRSIARHDPAFDPLRGNPRFESLLAEAKPDPAQPAAISASTPDPKSIVVLPFANLSGDPAQEYFSDGLTEEILNVLARERDLRVPGRTSAFAFKGKSQTAPEIARALNVAQVVEGSVRKAGNQVRITITLTHAADGFSEPLGTFTEKLEDIFALQEKVARAVVEKITHRTTTATTVAVQTRNPAAYDAYLRGRAAQMAVGMKDEAVRLFKEAIQLDPNYALAWARLSQIYERRIYGGFDRGDENRVQAREAAEQALRLGRDLPEAHFAMAMIKLGSDWQADAAQREFDEAVKLRPNDPEAPWIQARIDFALGRWDKNLGDLIVRAANLDRQNAPVLFTMAQLLSTIGRFADADEWCARAAALSPNVTLAERGRARNRAIWTGDIAGALQFVASATEATPGAELTLATRGDLRAELGDLAGAITDYEAAKRVAATLGDYSGPRGWMVWDDCKIARLEIRRGNRARADEILQNAQLDAQKLVQDFPQATEGSLFLALVYALRGEKEASRAALAGAKKVTQQAHFAAKQNVGHFEAEILALLGDTRAAVADLRSLHEMGLAFGYGLRTELEWEPLRGDASFQQLMKEAEARADAVPRPHK